MPIVMQMRVTDGKLRSALADITKNAAKHTAADNAKNTPSRSTDEPRGSKMMSRPTAATTMPMNVKVDGRKRVLAHTHSTIMSGAVISSSSAIGGLMRSTAKKNSSCTPDMHTTP